ncbi:hypothetical protein ACIRPK_26910 [Kitasatospora sp. NPDC101801]|uniref:hypothetical protein n=1 Tax=Kitasatospora sp. NPDC101801 TaxID=3364103 RepID=UPI0037F85739
MVLLSIGLTAGLLVVGTCGAVAVARARGGNSRSWGPRSASLMEKIMAGIFVFVTGAMLPGLYVLAGVVSGPPPRWLPFVTAALLLAGCLLIGRLVTRIRWALWSDELLTQFIGEAMPVVVTAQRRAGDHGAKRVEKMRVALREGRGRDALRDAVEVRALVESAGLPEHAAWTEVSGQILYWQESHLPARSSRARSLLRTKGTLAG